MAYVVCTLIFPWRFYLSHSTHRLRLTFRFGDFYFHIYISEGDKSEPGCGHNRKRIKDKLGNQTQNDTFGISSQVREMKPYIILIQQVKRFRNVSLLVQTSTCISFWMLRLISILYRNKVWAEIESIFLIESMQKKTLVIHQSALFCVYMHRMNFQSILIMLIII